MSEDLIVSLGLQDKGVAKQISALNKELKFLDKEFKATGGTSKQFENTTEGLNKKLVFLQKSYDANKLKLSSYNKKLEESKAGIAKKEAELKKLTSAENINEKAVEKVTRQLASMKEGLRDTERNIALTEAELSRLSNEMKNTQTSIKGLRFNELGKQLEKIGGNLKTVGNRMSGFGKSLMLGVSAPILGLGVACINAAKNLSEMQKKSQVVFGDMTDDVAKWSLENERSFGLGAGTIQGMATELADLTQGMGQSKEASFEMAKGATELAVQLGNWGNVDPAQTMQDLKSALSGSHKAMEKYGVKLNQNVLDEQTRAMGLGDTFDKLTEAQKAEVRYQAILEASGNAIQYWNEGNRGMAFHLTEAKEQIGNVAENLGMALLPTVTEVAKKVADLTSKFAEWSAKNPELLEKIIKIAGAVALIGPVLIIFGKVISVVGGVVSAFGALSGAIGAAGGVVAFIGTLFTPLTLIIGVVIATVVALALAWKNNFGGIQEKTRECLENIKIIIASVLTFIKDAWNNDLMGIKTTAMLVWDNIKTIFLATLDIIFGIVKMFTCLVQGDWQGCFDNIKNIVNIALNACKTVIDNILKIICNIFGIEFDKIKVIADTIWNNIKIIFDTALNVIKGVIQYWISFFKGDWQGCLDAVKNIASTIWEGIKNIFSNALNGLLGVIQNIAPNMYAKAQEMFNKAKEAFIKVWNSIKSWFSGAVNDPVNTLKGIGGALYNAGRSVFSSIWDGMKSIWSNITSWVSDKVSWLKDKLTFWNNSKSEMNNDGEGRSRSIEAEVQVLQQNTAIRSLDNVALSGSYYNADTKKGSEFVSNFIGNGGNSSKSNLEKLVEKIESKIGLSNSKGVHIDNVTINNQNDVNRALDMMNFFARV